MAADLFAVEFEGDRQNCQWRRELTGRVTVQKGSYVNRAVWGRVLAAAFLPDGYPSSVTGDYLAFQGWDSLQALCRCSPVEPASSSSSTFAVRARTHSFTH